MRERPPTPKQIAAAAKKASDRLVTLRHELQAESWIVLKSLEDAQRDLGRVVDDPEWWVHR